jgi:hypothetical protein
MVRRLRSERSSSALQADVLTTITIGANSPVIYMRFFTDGPHRTVRIKDLMNNRISDFLFRATPRSTMVDNIPRSWPTMHPEPIEIRMRFLYPAGIPSPSSSTHFSAFSLVVHNVISKGPDALRDDEVLVLCHGWPLLEIGADIRLRSGVFALAMRCSTIELYPRGGYPVDRTRPARRRRFYRPAQSPDLAIPDLVAQAGLAPTISWV